MSEINNNIPKFGYNIEKIDNSKNIEKIKQEKIQPDSDDKKYVPDTGVLGRSQVKTVKGGDITKSVDEAVALATQHPEILECGDKIFDSVYDNYIAQGDSPEMAYVKASLGQEEFLHIAKP